MFQSIDQDSAALPADIVLPLLSGKTSVSPGRWRAHCPRRCDRRPTLAITEASDFRLWMYCESGCRLWQILDALGLRQRHLEPSERAVTTAVANGRRQSAYSGAAGPYRAGLDDQAAEARTVQLANYAESCRAAGAAHLGHLAAQLGLTAASLRSLGVGWDGSKRAWTFPEYDGSGRTIGVMLRGEAGGKRALTGSRRGLTVPADLLQIAGRVPAPAPLLIAVGATDTAALHMLGCLVIGQPLVRPTAAARDALAALLRRYPSLHEGRQVALLAHNDAPGGLAGAWETQHHVQVAVTQIVHVFRPPDGVADVRELLNRGGQLADLVPAHQYAPSGHPPCRGGRAGL